jgi:3-hydroxyisobutyrate dehydrogenase-like beta-hydroxyacid dehydrogenase
MRIAWIGLGTMGAPMAGHLLAAGHELHVHNRTRAREEPLAAAGAIRADSAAEAAHAADLVFTCVSDSPDVEEIVLGERGIAGSMRPGAVLVDCSTVSPETAKKLAAALSPIGVGSVDAPVSGGSEGARNGTLTVFVGGEDAHVQVALPALQTFARSVTYLGLPGAGQAGKAVNQVLIAGTYAALGEGLALAEREGLPLPELVAALSGGAARSWILENRSKNVIENEYPLGFRVALHLKDLKIALSEADRYGLPMAVTRLVAEQEERLVAAGHGDEDNSVLARVAKGEVS